MYRHMCLLGIFAFTVAELCGCMHQDLSFDDRVEKNLCRTINTKCCPVFFIKC